MILKVLLGIICYVLLEGLFVTYLKWRVGDIKKYKRLIIIHGVMMAIPVIWIMFFL